MKQQRQHLYHEGICNLVRSKIYGVHLGRLFPPVNFTIKIAHTYVHNCIKSLPPYPLSQSLPPSLFLSQSLPPSATLDVGVWDTGKLETPGQSSRGLRSAVYFENISKMLYTVVI